MGDHFQIIELRLELNPRCVPYLPSYNPHLKSQKCILPPNPPSQGGGPVDQTFSPKILSQITSRILDDHPEPNLQPWFSNSINYPDLGNSRSDTSLIEFFEINKNNSCRSNIPVADLRTHPRLCSIGRSIILDLSH